MKHRGRPNKWKGPTIVTSVRLPLEDWKWVKDHKKLEFSGLLARQIHELQLDELSGPIARFIREARKIGITDGQVGPLIASLQLVPPSEPSP